MSSGQATGQTPARQRDKGAALEAAGKRENGLRHGWSSRPQWLSAGLWGLPRLGKLGAAAERQGDRQDDLSVSLPTGC